MNTSIQFSQSVSLVTESCLTPCIPMDCSMPGFPVHHQLPELALTHVHRVGDAVQPSHSLSSFLLLPSSFPSISVFSNESVLCTGWPKYWSFSFSISSSSEWLVRTDFFYNVLVESPCSPRDSQESSPTPQFKSIHSSALSFLYSPTLTSIPDDWKNRTFDCTDK